MMIKIELIDNVPCISCAEIARTSANDFYNNASDQAKEACDLAEFYKAHYPIVKARLIELAGEGMERHIYRRPPLVFADRAAFFELAQIYNWPEEYFQAVLTELGEYTVSEVAA